MSFLSELVGREAPPEMDIRLRDLDNHLHDLANHLRALPILPLYGVKR